MVKHIFLFSQPLFGFCLSPALQTAMGTGTGWLKLVLAASPEVSAPQMTSRHGQGLQRGTCLGICHVTGQQDVYTA